MKALHLVTTPQPFFRQQIATLERAGVDCTTVSVPGERGERSVLDYLRYYPDVLSRTVGRPDVVHANFGLTIPFALAQPNRPVVCSLWGSDLYGRYGAVSRWCAKRCDAVVVMSEEMADELDAACHVIPHGIDMKRFRPMDRDNARTDLGWRADAKHVLFPYTPERGVKDYPRAERVVDAARERLDTPVELQTIHDVPHERMPTYMNAADALLLTSKWEGSPNAVREALACNLPVVSTDVGDVRDRLAGVSYSTVCRADEELVAELAAVLDAGERADGRETVRDVSAERMGRRLKEVYESVCE